MSKWSLKLVYIDVKEEIICIPRTRYNEIALNLRMQISFSKHNIKLERNQWKFQNWLNFCKEKVICFPMTNYNINNHIALNLMKQSTLSPPIDGPSKKY